MPYIDKNGKPVLWEETDYFNQYRKALIYYPVKAKRISGIPDCDFTYEILVSPTPTPTQTGTPTPTPSPSAPSVDPDAAAYLADVVTSGGTTNPTIEAAVNTLFTSLKSNGFYSKMLAMYPYVGSTASSHAINALLNKSYDISWNGGVSHSISGSTGDGINGYGNTSISTTIFTSLSANTIGYYQYNNQQVSSNSVDMGIITNGGSTHSIYITSNTNGDTRFRNQKRTTAPSTSTPLDNSGGWINTRLGTGTTDAYLYFRGNTTPYLTSIDDIGTTTSDNVLIFNASVGSNPLSGYYANNTHNFTFIMDDGLTPSEVSTLDGIINTFQTSLGRNTY